MQLLRHSWRLRPSGARKVLDLLEGELARSIRVYQHKPVRIIRRLIGGGLVTAAVAQAQQLPLEVRSFARVRALENGMQ